MKNNYIIKDDINLIKSNKLLFHAYKIKFDLIKKYIGKKNLIEKFDFVTQPQKFFGSNNNKDIIKIYYISEYFFIFTGGASFHKLQKFIPNFVYSFLLKFDDFLNKSKNSVIKKFFATKILVVLG